MQARYHATPASRCALVKGRWFEDAGRAVAWAQHTATALGLPLVVWRISTGPPVRLQLVRRVEPASGPAC